MKILYAIQGTGNGHLARATEIIPKLMELAETDVLISGIQSDIDLPFPVRYRLYGLSFIFGTEGGVDILRTIMKFRFYRFVRDIFRLPVKKYNLVLTDFEPVSAWACKLKGKKCISISHQNSVLHPSLPKPVKISRTGEFILKYYAPGHEKYGFHFIGIDDKNFTPVIRNAISSAIPENKGHYTVYLPAYSDETITAALSVFPHIRWEVFSKHCKTPSSLGNIHFQPVSLEKFNSSFIHCEGILCNAGFETPAEALFMGKKLCVIPMKNQYEQACNAALLKQLGVTVLDKLHGNSGPLKQWLESPHRIQINYPDHTSKILESIILNSPN
jgi:uncharacterized protein (TIGR00661 family)